MIGGSCEALPKDRRRVGSFGIEVGNQAGGRARTENNRTPVATAAGEQPAILRDHPRGSSDIHKLNAFDRGRERRFDIRRLHGPMIVGLRRAVGGHVSRSLPDEPKVEASR